MCSVRARSTHANKLNPTLPHYCRIIAGCLKQINTESILLYQLAGIAPPDITRTVASKTEITQQQTEIKHNYTNKCLLRVDLNHGNASRACTTPLSTTRINTCETRLQETLSVVKLGQRPTESLPPEFDQPRLSWRPLKLLRTGVGRVQSNMKKWGYIDETQLKDVTAEKNRQCPACPLPPTAGRAVYVRSPVSRHGLGWHAQKRQLIV